MPVELMLTAFVMGIFGSVHCIGMCGGIIGSLSMSLSTQIKPKPAPLFWYLLNYNIGRIISYVFIGALIGLVSNFTIRQLPNPHQTGMLISGIFLIVFGLYISQLWMGMSKIEQWVSPLWRFIQPFSQRYLPPETPAKALPLGMIWGWLPCGLVYSVLPIAYSSGSVQGATLVMLAFGLATMPMLMLLGNSAQFLKNKLQLKAVRITLGGILIIWGLNQIFNFVPLMPTTTPLMQH